MEIKDYLNEFIPHRDSNEQDLNCSATTLFILQSFGSIKNILVEFLMDDTNDKHSPWTVNFELQLRGGDIYHKTINHVDYSIARSLLHDFTLVDIAVRYDKDSLSRRTRYSLINEYDKSPQLGEVICKNRKINLILDYSENFTVEYPFYFDQIGNTKDFELLKWLKLYSYVIINYCSRRDHASNGLIDSVISNPIEVMIGFKQSNNRTLVQDWNSKSVLLLKDLAWTYNDHSKYIHCKSYDQINWLYLMGDDDMSYCIYSDDIYYGIRYITFSTLISLLDEAIANNGGAYDSIRSLYEN